MLRQQAAVELEPSRQRSESATDPDLFDCYACLRQCRQAPDSPEAAVWQLVDKIIDHYADEWLLLFEAAELLSLRSQNVGNDNRGANLRTMLRNNLPSDPCLEKVLIDALRRMEIGHELG